MRIISRLDIKSDYMIKSIRYEGLRNLGQPEVFAEKYFNEGVTEIFVNDNVASLYRRPSSFETLKNVSNNVFVPVIFCGGLHSLDDAKRAFDSGADKVALNTGLFSKPELIEDVAKLFGQQSVIVSIEAKHKRDDLWECYTHNGRERTRVSVKDWVKKTQDLGAGEIYVSSVDRDGTHLGYEIDLISQVLSESKIPVVASSGAGSLEHIKKVASLPNLSGVSVGSALHYNKISIEEIIKVTKNEK